MLYNLHFFVTKTIQLLTEAKINASYQVCCYIYECSLFLCLLKLSDSALLMSDLQRIAPYPRLKESKLGIIRHFFFISSLQ